MATTNTIPDPEPDYSRFTDNMLDDDLWAELPLEEQRRLVSGLRSRTLHALGMLNEDIKVPNQPPTQFRELRRRRVKTVTFLELINERAVRIRTHQTQANIQEANQATVEKYRALRRLVEMHRTINNDPLSTDAELDATDRRLYAELGNPTQKEN